MTARWRHSASWCSFYILFPFKRPEIGNEEELVPVLQKLIDKSLNEVSLEAALCLGFLRPSNSMVQEFLLLCLCQGPMPQRMKVWEAGSQDPWEVLGKQWPMLTWPVLWLPSHPKENKFHLGTQHSSLCVYEYVNTWLWGYMDKQVYTHTCIWYECSFIYMCTYPLVLLFKRPKGRKKHPLLIPHWVLG